MKLDILRWHRVNMLKVLCYLNMSICSSAVLNWVNWVRLFSQKKVVQWAWSQAFQWYNFLDILCNTSSYKKQVASFLITYSMRRSIWPKNLIKSTNLCNSQYCTISINLKVICNGLPKLPQCNGGNSHFDQVPNSFKEGLKFC